MGGESLNYFFETRLKLSLLGTVSQQMLPPQIRVHNSNMYVCMYDIVYCKVNYDTCGLAVTLSYMHVSQLYHMVADIRIPRPQGRP